MINKIKYKPVLDYIENYWDKIVFFDPKHHWALWHPTSRLSGCLGYMGLPRQGVSPNHTFFYKSQFYWDSYFTILGLVVSGRIGLARDMVSNLRFLFKKYGIILARNRFHSRGKTQPPFLTSMAFEIFEHERPQDINFLAQTIQTAKEEYRRVWCAGKRWSENVDASQYNPVGVPKWVWSQFESGWDTSTRFWGAGKDLIPVDLNACLYRYEADFAKFAEMGGNNHDAEMWRNKMEERNRRMNELFWNEKEGFYFDYNLATKKQDILRTLAGFYPLWAGAASPEQAKRVVANLAHFETSGGLANTEKIPWKKRQWDWPNGWPGQQYIAIAGLRRYGFHSEAERIATKWLNLNAKIFQKTGVLWEKYDVVNEAVGLSGLYPTQAGFGWTNGVFIRLISDLVKT